MPAILCYPNNACSCCRDCLERGVVPCRSDYFQRDSFGTYLGRRPCRLSSVQHGDGLSQDLAGADAGDSDDFDNLYHSIHDAYTLGCDMVLDSVDRVSLRGRQ